MDTSGKNANQIIYRPIGVIHSPFDSPEGAPIQPAGARGVKGRVEVFEPFAPGLRDLDGFSHLILLYHCHLCGDCKLEVEPFLDKQPHGVFAVRAPARPNSIGLSVVRLDSMEGNLLRIMDVDVLNGTPLLDIKPYVPDFDQPAGPVRIGWLEQKAGSAVQAKGDDRFGGPDPD